VSWERGAFLRKSDSSLDSAVCPCRYMRMLTHGQYNAVHAYADRLAAGEPSIGVPLSTLAIASQVCGL
jgi:hypothetical protein